MTRSIRSCSSSASHCSGSGSVNGSYCAIAGSAPADWARSGASGSSWGHPDERTFGLAALRQHFLYFLPLPQGQGSLRPIFPYELIMVGRQQDRFDKYSPSERSIWIGSGNRATPASGGRGGTAVTVHSCMLDLTGRKSLVKCTVTENRN